MCRGRVRAPAGPNRLLDVESREPTSGGPDRVAESVAKRLSGVKHFGRYDGDLRRAARSPHDSTPHDRVNAGKRLLRGGGDRLPVLGARPATEVVERHRAGPAGLSHDDPADHSRRLVGLTEVVVDARDGEGHVVAVARVHEEPRVPGRRAFGDAQRVAVVLRMVRRGRVNVRVDDPPHRLSRLDPDADGVTSGSKPSSPGRPTSRPIGRDGGSRSTSVRSRTWRANTPTSAARSSPPPSPPPAPAPDAEQARPPPPPP